MAAFVEFGKFCQDLKDIPTVAIWTNRYSDFQVRCAKSVMEHTKRDLDLLIVCSPGSCHRNMNKVFERAQGRYVCFLDEDVVILQDNWIEKLIFALKSNDSYAIVGCREVKKEEESSQAPIIVGTRELVPMDWVPAYTMCFDLDRLPGIRADENIPWIKGMTDVDLCYQCRQRGFRVGMDQEVLVYHQLKDAETLRRYGIPSEDENRENYPPQVEYMKKKWGSYPALWQSKEPIHVVSGN